MKQAVVDVTGRIAERSAAARSAYLARIDAMVARPRGPEALGCANAAHAVAAMPASDKLRIVAEREPNIGVVTACNGMLSALQPYQAFPATRRETPLLNPGQVAVNGQEIGRGPFAGMRRDVVSAKEAACTWL